MQSRFLSVKLYDRINIQRSYFVIKKNLIKSFMENRYSSDFTINSLISFLFSIPETLYLPIYVVLYTSTLSMRVLSRAIYLSHEANAHKNVLYFRDTYEGASRSLLHTKNFVRVAFADRPYLFRTRDKARLKPSSLRSREQSHHELGELGFSRLTQCATIVNNCFLVTREAREFH